ncbi:MAG TPA: SIMPL domain-containing protein [Acidobacteriaceae bacterium]|nr:SIMPL domain-containing protein [Acidobacteriaceae bacterium]
MRKTLLWFSLVLTVAAAHAQMIQVDKNNRTIAVTTSDTATELADVATVTVGFEIYAPDAQTAYSQGSQLSNAIMEAMKKAGVPEKAIQSKEQQLTHTEFPEYDKTPPEDRAKKQFTLSQSWTVRVPAKDASAVLHVAIEAGGNESGAIGWDVADRSALQAKAAAKALIHARQIASQMAEGLGAKLGTLVYASNQERPTPIQAMAEAAMPNVGVPPPAPAPLAVVPQNVEESATVYAVFAIE